MIQINPKNSVPIYRQVVDQVKRMVMTGQLESGDQLESVSSLSQRVKVNPMTISKAYSILVQEGVAERRRGIGMFINEMEPETVAAERRELLAGALEKAAVLAVQMGVSEKSATDQLLKQMEHYKAQSKGKSS